MRLKQLLVTTLVAFVGVSFLHAETSSPSPTPSASPAKRAHKKSPASPAPSASSAASPAPASSSASPAASPKQRRSRKNATASPSPTASASPSNPLSAIGNLFKPKTAASPAPAASSTTSAKTSAPNPAMAPGGGNGKVWVNTETKVYHKEGSRWYGKTKKGEYMSEQDAIKQGAHADKEESRPKAIPKPKA